MKVLLQYGQSSKVVQIDIGSDIEDRVHELYGLQNSDFFLKKFCCEFNEYIDIDNLSDIQNMDKLIIVKNNQELSKTQDVPEVSGVYELVLLQESEGEVTTDSGSKKERFPTLVDIPFEDFSIALRNCLDLKTHLTWDASRELVDHLANHIYLYNRYPTKSQRQQVCLSLVTKYPHLSNTIGLGIGAWETKLNNKLKRIRQRDNSLEVTLMRNASKNESGKVQNPPRIVSRGEINWSPDHLPGETLETLFLHKELLKKEAEKDFKDRNEDLIKSIMNLTYSFRRVEINAKATVMEILTHYPLFFEVNHQFDEFKRLMNIDIASVFRETALDYGLKLLYMYEGKKLSSTLRQKLNQFDEESADLPLADLVKVRAAYGILMLPYLFKEKTDLLVMQVSEDSDTVELGEICHPLIYGDIQVLDGFFNISIEGITVCQVKGFLTAVAVVMSFYYTLNIAYPSKIRNTLKFIQTAILSISDTKHSPRVLSFIKKL